MQFGHLCAYCDIAVNAVPAVCPGCGANVSWAPEYLPSPAPILYPGALVSDLLSEVPIPNP